MLLLNIELFRVTSCVTSKQAELEVLLSPPSQRVPTVKRDGQDDAWAFSGNTSDLQNSEGKHYMLEEQN